MRMDAGITSLVEECADQGLDIDDVLAARVGVVKRLKEHGLALPAWATQPAGDAAQKPEKAQPQ
jgi:capsid protein